MNGLNVIALFPHNIGFIFLLIRKHDKKTYPIHGKLSFGPAYVSFVLIAHAQKPPLNTLADLSSGVCGLKFRLKLYVHSNDAYASIVGSGECAHMRRLALVFAARQCNKHQNLMCWHNCNSR